MQEKILSFWFEEIDSRLWWNGGKAFDSRIRDQFRPLLDSAIRGELFNWRSSVRGRLAEIIVLDQFSRNIFRNTPQAFAQDGMALILAQEAVACGSLDNLEEQERNFLLMPYMHSESKAIHVHAEELFRKFAAEASYTYELRHKAIIDRFGRYPHRNEILGRTSSQEELEFLSHPGSSF